MAEEPGGNDAVEAHEDWDPHLVVAGAYHWSGREPPTPAEHKASVEPWLSALLQSDHLSLLIGSGFTTALAQQAGATALQMDPADLPHAHSDRVNHAATEAARVLDRGAPNIEDQIRTVRQLVDGLGVLVKEGEEPDDPFLVAARDLANAWSGELDAQLGRVLRGVLATERGIAEKVMESTDRSDRLRRLLGGFLLSFASRTASRERLQIFTTNYDRLIEFGCDLLGLRVVDRFVGIVFPVFRGSRLGVDLHYNPPGIRGEPRYLEGVVRLGKLHGSVDWQRRIGPSGRPEVLRASLPFGAADDHPDVPATPADSLLIYPNPAKDVETLAYPYAELFRDLASAICQPNSVLFTYGYGFGDDHINRTIAEMLTVPSSHLVVLSHGACDGRIQRFCERVARPDQLTLMIGPHFGDLSVLVDNYLPNPAIDRNTWRMVELANRRVRLDRRGDGDDNDASG